MMKLRRDENGAIYVEFLLVFMPVFLIFLGLVQASLMFAANLIVAHAANVAARAAMVVLDDDPGQYGNEKRNDLTGATDPNSNGGGGSTSTGGDPMGSLLNFSGANTSGISQSSSPSSGGTDLSGKRIGAIRGAAQVALLPMSPSFQNIMSPNNSPSVYQAINGGQSTMSSLGGSALYNQMAVAVTFPTAPGSADHLNTFGANDSVTVRVTYMFQCAVPIVNHIMCDGMMSLMTGIPTEALQSFHQAMSSGSLSLNDIQSMTTAMQNAQDRVKRGNTALAELDQAAMPSLRYYTLSGGRYTIMQREAMLPNHGAPYQYQQGN